MTYSAFRRWADVPLPGSPMLSVVIPAYNEERRIVPTIGAIASFCSDFEPSWELIVADDGSSDGTADLVEALHLANVRLLRDVNQGKGAAVRRGILAAGGELVLFTDADLSTPIEHLDPMVTLLRAGGADVVVGSRAAHGADVHSRSPLRRALTSATAALSKAVLHLGVNDTQCGFKLFDGAAARWLFSRQTITGFAFDLEILHLARRAGMTVVEVAVEWHDAPGSKVSGVSDTFRGGRDLLRIRANTWLGRYDELVRS
jgi:dolichyl-phosphate beta-glucosyltransferase